MAHIQFSKLFLLFGGVVSFLVFGSNPAFADLYDAGFRGIAQNIVDSIDRTPGLVAAISYLLGVGFGVKAILKLKEHVENPSNIPLRMPVIHGLIGGGLLALPTVLTAMINTIDPNTTEFSPPIENVTDAAGALGIVSSILGVSSFNQIFANLVHSLSNTPILVFAFSYLAGLIMAVSALLKLKEHVEDANRTPLRTPVIRFLIGGALITLPSIYNAVATTISPNYEAIGFLELIGGIFTNTTLISDAVTGTTNDTNAILSNILGSTSGFPTLISSLGFFLGLIIVVSGLFKIKEHVEEEGRTPIREGVVRLLVGGALIAIPVIFASMYHAISGLDALFSLFSDEEATLVCDKTGTSLGSIMCKVFSSTSNFPMFLTVIAYFAGTAVGIWSILQFQEHVISPQQVKLWDPFSKMLAAGGLFSLPTVVSIASSTLAGTAPNQTNTGFNEGGEDAEVGTGLDGMISSLMADTFAPMTTLISWFGIIAGFILIFIGISRLMKSAQEGAKGPGGIGTIMTFVAGGALLSFSPMVSSFTASLFTDHVSQTYASLSYTAGMSDGAIARSNIVIASIFKFVILLGLISIARGIFIVRGVSEGSSQASMMAGVTHIIGGTLAVNIGGFINVVQETLGITTYGLTIGGG